ncbi:SSU ribosomal protein S12P methylthiotransferase [Kytococcus aerolatus]|uniref:Ribosomal protein uS12 methylthiotransferase RimO n=1 Tax=Kytococcus aerolatus TaxID=592308 RepID=A0A212T5Y5_9MICO|nr:30S ribosomal protein S12 methylthiotransferase RimO [Kytococcus aerolatus]SNC61448.1 SSU ribosomal protein S12P methylthiotransferase [Kytococcus aerolatus]
MSSPSTDALPETERPSVHIATLGCTRNAVDSEELAGRLAAAGWELAEEADGADVTVVNTCGFVESAKKDSIDALLEAHDLKSDGRTGAVVAVGCMAERYGSELAAELPEADAVLGFDSYADMSASLRAVLDGNAPAAHTPGDRRRLLPLSPVDRQAGAAGVALPGHGDVSPEEAAAAGLAAITPVEPGDASLDGPAPASGPSSVIRRRLDDRPWAPLKIASGCDRRCAFCAIPSFRGAHISRRPTDVLAEARWLAENGVRELFLVSENTTSYGKDLGDLRLLDALLPELTAIGGIERVRVSYLQPAETRPELLTVMTSTPGVVPYFDLSFQHASGPLLRRMRRFGDAESFLGLIEQVRAAAPTAGIRSNVICGFPGETEEEVDLLADFVERAQLDVLGVFGYSDEDGTEAERLGDKLPQEVVDARVARIRDLAEEVMAQRAADRVGESVSVLVEEIEELELLDEDTGEPTGESARQVIGRAEHQGPEVDGVTILQRTDGSAPDLRVGEIVAATVVGSEGVDLVARGELA